MSIFTGSTCVPVKIFVENSFWDVDKLSLGLAFLLGCFGGILICLCCAKICMKDCIKAKYNDSQHFQTRRVTARDDSQDKLIPKEKEKKVKKKKKRGGKVDRKRGGEPLVPVTVITLDDYGKTTNGVPSAGHEGNKAKGLADVLLQQTNDGRTAELTNQDLTAIEDLDKELREESINTMVQMLRVMLNKQMIHGKLTDDQYKELVSEMQDSVSNVVQQCQQEREEEEQKLLNNKKMDADQLEAERDALDVKYSSQMNSMVKEEKERLRKGMAKKTELSDDEIDLMLSDYANNMAEMERKLGLERQRQAANLEERLEKRKKLVESYSIGRDVKQKEIEHRVEGHDENLKDLVDKGSLQERQREEILQQYKLDLTRLQMKNEDEITQQQQHLAEKLQSRRKKRMQELLGEQEQQREEMLTSADGDTNTSHSMEAYHDLLQRQRGDRDLLQEEMDVEDADALNDIRMEFEDRWNQEVEAQEADLTETLRTQAQLSEKEAGKLIRLHDQHMEEFDRVKKAEKKAAKQKLQEKLNSRRQKLAEAAEIESQQQDAIKKQQISTVEKVLESQIDLSADAKDRIMQEHEQNVTAINNQLQMSRMRQQKRLEAKLNARKAKVADLKHKQEQAKMDRSKEKQKLVEQLEKEIIAEEKKLQEDKVAKKAALRKRLSDETTAALAEQEKQLGQLIARLQVGAARRQELIKKQDMALKELESQLTERVAETVEEEQKHGEDEPSDRMDHLLQQHHAQVEHLTDRMNEDKERQQRLLKEKIEKQKLRREKTNLSVDGTVAREMAQQGGPRMSGAGLATSLLTHAMMDQRHKASMKQLEKEMEMEMQRQRAELNEQMEAELAVELEEQKKRFLATLAAIGNVSKSEMSEIVENAVADTGGTERQANKLTKQMNTGLKQAKSDMAAEGEYDDRNRRRRSYRHYDEELDYGGRRSDLY